MKKLSTLEMLRGSALAAIISLAISAPFGVLAEDAPVAVPSVADAPAGQSNVAANASIAYSQLNLRNRITSLDIKDGTITSKDVAEHALKGSDIATHTISSRNLKDNSINGSKIKDNAISSDEIKNGEVKNEDLGDGAVGTSKLADNSVTSTKILDGTIVNADISATAAIDGTKINPDFGSQDITTSGGASIAGLVDTGSIATHTGADINGIFNAYNDVNLGDGDDNILVGGILTINSSYLTDSTGTIDIGNYDTGTDNINLNGDVTVDGNIAPANDATNDLGSDTSRWSSIYADTLNFKNSLTDTDSADSTISFGNGNDATINIGDDPVSDTVNIQGNVAITDLQWSISDTGNAAFNGIKADSLNPVTNGAPGFFNWHIGELYAANTTLTIDPATVNIDGDVTLGDANTDTVTIRGDLAVRNNANDADTITFENNTGTITAATFVGDVTGDLTGNADSATTASTVSNNAITSAKIADGTIAAGDLAGNIDLATTGTVDFSGAASIKIKSATIGGVCSTNGAIAVNPAGNAGERILVCDGNNWLAN